MSVCSTISSSPVGLQTQWVIDTIASTAPVTEAEIEQHFHPAFLAAVPAKAVSDLLIGLRQELRQPQVVAVNESGQHCTAAIVGLDGTRFKLSVILGEVEEPHRISGAQLTPLADGTSTPWADVEALGVLRPADDLDERLAEIRSRLRAPGLLAGFLKDGGTLDVRAVGVGDVAGKEPVHPESVLRIGSITKTFTAIAVLQLVESGAVRLDDDVSAHLTAYYVRSPDGCDRPITLRHLLTHTSGLPQAAPSLGMYEGSLGVPEGAPLPSLAEFFGPGLTGVRPPGESWEYNNLGFATLGQVIADVGGFSYRDYMVRNVFDVLGMTSTDVIRSERCAGPTFTGYESELGDVTPVAYTDIIVQGAGSVFSTVADMGRYADAIFGGGANAHGRVLQPESLALLLSPQRELDPASGMSMCLGFLSFMMDAHRVVWHNGGWPGANSELWIAPDDRTAVLLFANCFSAISAPQLDQAAAALLKLVLYQD